MTNLASRASQYSLKTAPSMSDKFSVSYGDRSKRASGGRVTTAEMMLSRSKIARKKRQAQTKAILDKPDEHVAHALKIASHTLNESDNNG